MDVLRRAAGGDPELCSEQDAQAVVDTKRFCDVPSSLERLHQNQMAALAKGSELDQMSRTVDRLRQLRPAMPRLAVARTLQAAQPNVLQASAPILQPGRVVARQQRSACDIVARLPGPHASNHSPFATRDSARWRASTAASTSTNVSAGSTTSIWARPVTSAGPATRRSFDSKTLSRAWCVWRRVFAVDSEQKLVALDPAKAVHHEVGEKQLPLEPGQRLLDPPSVQGYREPAAELDPRLRELGHGDKPRKLDERFVKAPAATIARTRRPNP